MRSLDERLRIRTLWNTSVVSETIRRGLRDTVCHLKNQRDLGSADGPIPFAVVVFSGVRPLAHLAIVKVCSLLTDSDLETWRLELHSNVVFVCWRQTEKLNLHWTSGGTRTTARPDQSNITSHTLTKKKHE
jgi:hypothetical protein